MFCFTPPLRSRFVIRLVFQRATLESLISRRALFALPALSLAAACSPRQSGGYRGYAFIAAQEGQALAAIDLEVMAVARHIALDDAPAQVLAAATRPAIYALTPATGSVVEVQLKKLSVSRKATVASTAVAMALAPDERSLYVLARQPRALIAVDLDGFRQSWSLPLQEEPSLLTISDDGQLAGITSGKGVWLVDLAQRRAGGPLLEGDFGAAQFRHDGKLLMIANRGANLLSLIDTASGRLVTHLPVPFRPEQFCMKQDGGELFVTGEGMDSVVIVSPYQTEIEETVLAGHAPGAMAVSDLLLFVASPQSGDVSILDINSRKVIAVVQVGADPGAIVVTPDNRYALVLNRKSGDVAVLRASTLAGNRFKWALLTVIPVGSRPVSAAVRGV
jgi:YVTN family beta-propeller protein